MKKISQLVAAVLILSIMAMGRAEACYSQREFEAEQGLRIHSELMVIGLTCIKMPGDEDLYSQYQYFTRKNAALISGYEDDMIRYYRNQGSPTPLQDLHTLRTNLANEISRRAIKMSIVSFCEKYSPRIGQALAMDHDKIRMWASQVWPSQPTTEPLCSVPAWRN